MRVLHTNFLRGWGGQSNRILMECEALASRGWEILLSVPGESELARRAITRGIPVDSSVSYENMLRSVVRNDVRRFRQLVERFQPEIVHLHGGRDSWIAALALGTKARRPVIIRTKHNVFPISDHWFNRWMYGRFFDGIVCLSSAIVAQCSEKPYIDPRKLVLIPSACNVVDFMRAASAREKVRSEFGFAPDAVVIVMSGRLRPEKGHDILLAAVPRVLQQVPHAKFLLLGAGSLEGRIARELAEHNLTESIHLAGFRSDVAECLSAADIAVQPSRSEGLGTAVIEAAAAGLPVVATAVGGIPDVIVHGETGILVPPENPEALADAIVQLAQNPAQRRALGEAARLRVARLFSKEALGDKTDDYYRRMLVARRLA